MWSKARPILFIVGVILFTTYLINKVDFVKKIVGA